MNNTDPTARFTRVINVLGAIEILTQPNLHGVANATNIPPRTINDILARVKKIYGVQITRTIVNEGVRTTYYSIHDWGYFDKERIKQYYLDTISTTEFTKIARS